MRKSRGYSADQELRDRIARLEMALHESEAKYRGFYEHAPDLCCSVDVQTGLIAECNTTFLEKTGFSHEEVVGHSLLERYTPDSQDKAREALNRLLDGEHVRDAEGRLLRKEGGPIAVSLNADAVRDTSGRTVAARLVWRDITRRRQREERLRFQARLLDAVQQAVIATDTEGRIIYWNRFAEAMYGWKAEEVMGRAVLQVTPTDATAEQARQIMESLTKGETWQGEFEVRRKDGTSFLAYVADSPIFEGRRQVGVIGVSVDITEHRRAQRQWNKLFELSGDMLGIGSLRDHRWLRVNPAFSRVLGWSTDEILAMSYWDLIHSEDAQRVREALERLARGDTISELTNRVRCKDGTYRWIEWNTTSDPAEGLMYAAARDVTERERLLRQMEAERQLLSDMFEQAPSYMCIFSGPDHVYERTNALFDRMLGGRQAIGRPARDVWPETVTQATLDILDRVYRTGEPFTGTDVHFTVAPQRGRPASDMYLDLVYQPIRDADGSVTGILFQGVDRTEQHMAAQVRVEVEERFRLMADNQPLIIWVSDAEGRLVFGNQTLSEYTGIPRNELTGDTWERLIHPGDAEAYVGEFMAAVHGRRTFRGQARVRRADGEWRWLETWARPHFSPGGEFLGHVGTSADVTEHNELEAGLREADRRKDEFIAMLSHELRNPLASIATAAYLAQLQADHDPDQLENINIIERQAKHLTRLVDDLLEVSRISAGRVRLRQERVLLRDVVDAAVEMTRPLMEEAQHILTYSIAPSPVWVQADPQRITQAIGNLLSNAARYTQPGGHVWLTAGQEGDQAVVRVRDTGIGMTPEQITKAFDLFFQGEPGVARSRGGLGIGLTLVKQLVELHGGTVSAHSEGVGRGSEFVVRLPVVDDASAQAPAPGPEESKEMDGRTLNILLVEDSEDMLRVLRRVLERKGHRVRTAASGAEALKAASATPTPDVIFLDIGLPDMDGYDVAKLLRQQPDLQSVVLVALTGYGLDADRMRSQEAGFDHHLVKPPDMDVLQRILTSVAEGKAG